MNTLTILVMVSNLSQKLSSLLKSSLLARLPLLKLLLLPPLHKVVDKVLCLDSLLIKTLVVKVLSVDSLLIKTLVVKAMVLSFLTTVLVPSDLTEEEDLEEVSDSEEDSEVDSDLEETHTDGHRLVTTPNTPLLTHLMTLTSTL